MPQYVQDRLNIYDAILLLQGLGNTLQLCLGGLGLGLVIALFVGVARASRFRWLSWPAAVYIEIIRDSPLLMQLYLVFLAALMLNSSAFMAEIVRAGIQAVGKDQWDASRGLGMGYVQTMRHVVMPQAFRVMIPPGVGLLIGLIKDSSIVSVISYLELTRVGQILTEKTFLSFQVFGIVAALYFLMCYPLSRLALYAERRLKVGG
jgi:ABC-type amino acid transport system permease subunit